MLIESYSGIRGIYGSSLDEKVAVRYAYSYLQQLKNRNKNKKLKIIIGTDTRHSKDILKNAVIEALDCGIIDIGIATTPMAEFAVRHFKADGGIIITASHNEPYWNGFKFLDKDGAVLRPKDMDKVIEKYRKIKNLDNKAFFNKYLYKNKDPKKNIIKKTLKNSKGIFGVPKNSKNFFSILKKYNEINNAYSNYILDYLSDSDKKNIKNAKIKIIIDPNGGTGIIAKTILEKLNVKVHGINMKYGVFNRTIEPNEDSLIYLANEVRDRNYDLATGFDCDADRVEIVTSKGLITGNQLLGLIADDILQNAKNRTIVVNDATSYLVKEMAKRHNAKYIETQVGEINVVDKIYELKAPIGGEGSSSGVIIPPSRCRDGILTLVYLLKIIANKEKDLNDLLKTLPEYHNIKSKVKINLKKYDAIKKKLEQVYKKKNYKIIKSGISESLKIILDNGSFVWLRASKTEADILRIIADSKNKKEAELLIEEALHLLKIFQLNAKK